MINKDGMAEWEICAMCHGVNGISAMPKFPKLAGQKAAYLERQFKRFRSGERTNDGGQMQSITTEVTPSAVVGIMVYFAELPPPEITALSADFLAQNSALLARGKQLFYQGAGVIPACVICHADKSSQAPWIDGQHREYLYKQLEDFAGERYSNSDSNMVAIAASMSDQDRAAVALFASITRLKRG
jgi:cytochrome c553